MLNPLTQKRGAPNQYLFESMEVGDSFPVPAAKRLSVYQSARSWSVCRGLNWKFSVQKDDDGVYTCRRVE